MRTIHRRTAVIFPDIPKRYKDIQGLDSVQHVQRVQLQAPLCGSPLVEAQTTTIQASLGPAARSLNSRSLAREQQYSTDWSQGRAEYLTVFGAIVLWITFWVGIHYGFWTWSQLAQVFGS